MKNRVFSIITLLIMVASCLSLLVGCDDLSDIPVPEVKEDTYVYDEDNLLTPTTFESINNMLIELEEKTEIEFAVLTVKNLRERTIEEYANKVFNTLGIGKKDQDNGLLLLVSKADNKVKIEVGRGLEGYLTDAKCGRMLDEFFVPYREAKNYDKAISTTTQAFISVMAKENNVSVAGVESSIEKSAKEDDEDIGAGILIIILLIAILGAGAIMYFGDGSGSGFSGGGFSGGSSGGSFGGGFSGGGGASR